MAPERRSRVPLLRRVDIARGPRPGRLAQADRPGAGRRGRVRRGRLELSPAGGRRRGVRHRPAVGYGPLGRSRPALKSAAVAPAARARASASRQSDSGDLWRALLATITAVPRPLALATPWPVIRGTQLSQHGAAAPAHGRWQANLRDPEEILLALVCGPRRPRSRFRFPIPGWHSPERSHPRRIRHAPTSPICTGTCPHDSEHSCRPSSYVDPTLPWRATLEAEARRRRRKRVPGRNRARRYARPCGAGARRAAGEVCPSPTARLARSRRSRKRRLNGLSLAPGGILADLSRSSGV